MKICIACIIGYGLIGTIMLIYALTHVVKCAPLIDDTGHILSEDYDISYKLEEQKNE
jgi:hypothetical protein